MAELKEYFDNIAEFGIFKENDIFINLFEFKRLKEYDAIFKNYDLQNIAGVHDTFAKSLNIMQWIYDNSKYDGGSSLRPTTSDKIINHSFGKGEAGAINCANKAILLSDALISIGIFAMPVAISNIILNPESKIYLSGHSHVVVHVFIAEKNKWIVLDPSFNTYIVDKDGTPLNLIEISNLHRNNEKLYSKKNGSDELMDNGLTCLLLGLLYIQIWRGNDYIHRAGKFGWSTAYWLLAEKYLIQVQHLLNEPEANKLADNDIKFLNNTFIKRDKIYINEFLAIPKWK